MVKKRSDNYHGVAGIDRIQLPRELKSVKPTKKLNLSFEYDEALKLHAALTDCVNYLNRLNFSTAEAKRFRAWLTLDFANKNIFITSGATAKKPRT